MEPGSVRLIRGRERAAENDALAERAGGRVGLGGVLADLNRTGRPASPRRSAMSWGFIWDREDTHSARWWPQGITSSADADPSGQYDGRDVLVTTSYSKTVDGLGKGSRISVVDLTDRGRVRYRHVLLVVATLDGDGRVKLEPVRAHAGGAVWHGPYLHVAGTAKGIYTFCLDDIVAVGGTDRPELLGALPGGGLGGFGHRYVLPLCLPHSSTSADDVVDIRYSFLSLSHDGGGPPRLLAGEYGRQGMTTRLLGYDLHPASHLPTADPAGVSRPAFLHDGAVSHMQGAVSVGGRLHVTTSAGRHRRGSLWVGEAGRLRRYPHTLPPGPEDICYWPARDQLWSLSEHPKARVVFALDRARFG
jgi:hypothetical protein